MSQKCVSAISVVIVNFSRTITKEGGKPITLSDYIDFIAAFSTYYLAKKVDWNPLAQSLGAT